MLILSFKFFIKELPLFAFLNYILAKFVTVVFIFIHNQLETKQWSYALLWRNLHIEKNLNNLISPLLMAPLLETLVFCVIIWRLCQKFRCNGFVFIMISASLFSPYHLFGDGKGIYTLVYTFVGGCIFAYVYQQKIQKYKEDTAFICTALVHSLSNFLSVMA